MNPTPAESGGTYARSPSPETPSPLPPSRDKIYPLSLEFVTNLPLVSTNTPPFLGFLWKSSRDKHPQSIFFHEEMATCMRPFIPSSGAGAGFVTSPEQIKTNIAY